MGLEEKKLALLWEWIQHRREVLSQKLCQSKNECDRNINPDTQFSISLAVYHAKKYLTS